MQHIDTVRFGSGGEYSNIHESRHVARVHFLEVVRALCPEVLENLKEYVFPIYRDWATRAKQKPQYRPLAVSTIHPVFRSILLMQREAPQVATAVQQWSERFHLIGEMAAAPAEQEEQWNESARVDSLWPCQRAVEALYVWHWFPNGPQLMNQQPPGWPTAVRFDAGSTSPLPINIRRFRADRDRPANYVKQIITQIKLGLMKHIAAEQDHAHAGGQRRTPQKYRPEHFAWLALRQVRGWNNRRIAAWYQQQEHHRFEEGAIREGIRNTAQFLCLAIRPGQRGRPSRKSAESH